MTALNQKVSDKVDEIFLTIAGKFRTFLIETSPPVELEKDLLKTAMKQVSQEAQTYQGLLANDTIEGLPEKVDEFQEKLNTLQKVTAENLISTINTIKDFLASQMPTENS